MQSPTNALSDQDKNERALSRGRVSISGAAGAAYGTGVFNARNDDDDGTRFQHCGTDSTGINSAEGDTDYHPSFSGRGAATPGTITTRAVQRHTLLATVESALDDGDGELPDAKDSETPSLVTDAKHESEVQHVSASAETSDDMSAMGTYEWKNGCESSQKQAVDLAKSDDGDGIVVSRPRDTVRALKAESALPKAKADQHEVHQRIMKHESEQDIVDIRE